LDTGTHLVVGLGLAGLAHIDPVVSADPAVSMAVLAGTVIGSQAPDFDGLLRLKGGAAYIRNHRGASHSLPAIVIWTLLITAGIALIFGSLPFWHIGMWVLIAVSLHVFSDMFNSYGTQALRPFTKKWIRWNIIHIFDPFIFTTHILAIFCWAFRLAEPAAIFPALYVLTALYYVIRTIQHTVLQKRLAKQDPFHEPGDSYHLIPTIYLNQWNVIKKKPCGNYAMGDLKSGKLLWVDEANCQQQHPASEASKQHPIIASFIRFSPFSCSEVRTHHFGYEVRWADVRYRNRKQYPFVAVVMMDRDYHPIDSYIGWISESKLEKKLRASAY